MNKVFLCSVSMAAMTLCSGYANAGSFYGNMYEKELIKICKAAKENKLVKLKREVRNVGISYRRLQSKLKCNGVTLMDFAIDNNAQDTALYIARHVRIDANVVLAKLDSAEKERNTSDS